MNRSSTTTDHEEIRRWVEERGGRPATVKGTGKGGDAGLLRIDFPGRGEDDRLEEIEWDEFFEKFDEANLAFVYQEETAEGETSRFSRFVQRGSEDEGRGGSGGERRAGGKGR